MVMDIIKKNWIHLFAVVLFFLTTVFSFFPAFQGEKLQQSDKIQWLGMAQETREHQEATGETSLWTGSMFGGMPAYYINFKQPSDAIDILAKVMRTGFNNEIGKFMSGMLAFYLLLLLLGINPWIAIIGSIAFAYSTNNLVLLAAGHNTKVATIMISPLLIAGVILAYRKKFLLGGLVFTLGMAMNLKASHPQMTYYLGLLLAIYVLFLFVQAVKSNDILDFFKSSGILVIGLLIALGTTAGKTLPILEYSKDTMRGAPILKNSKSEGSSSKVDGLAWDYAMSWSNGSTDLLSSFIPLAVGGSNRQRISKNTNFGKELKKRGASTRNLEGPLYWGSLPWTEGPIYFGAVIFFLFFISCFYVKGNMKWWILSAVSLTFLLSLGKNFEGFNRFFFDYVPYYNKFRTPNSILSVTAILIPILAILGLQKFIDTKAFDKKTILYPGIGFILFTLAVGILGPGIFDMSAPGDTRLEQAGIKADLIIADRAAMLRTSAMTAALYMLITLASLWAFATGKLKKAPVLIIIGLIAVMDLFLVNFNYISSEKYQSKRKSEAYFTPRPVDVQILNDKDPNFRVLDNTINTFNSSFASYFHKTIGGNHAAKLQRFEDLRDYHITKNNMNVLNMLNTKYFITGQPGQEDARLNSAALGNAWFVNSVKIVPTADDEIEALSDFDPLGTAIVHQEFKSKLSSTSFDKLGSIKLDSYEPDRLVYTSNASSPQFAVFSEMWYGPNKGWKSYIDDQPVEHIRANYALRAMEVPSGTHKIVFEFKPDSNKTGKLIGLVSNILFLLGSAFYLWTLYKENKLSA